MFVTVVESPRANRFANTRIEPHVSLRSSSAAKCECVPVVSSQILHTLLIVLGMTYTLRWITSLTTSIWMGEWWCWHAHVVMMISGSCLLKQLLVGGEKCPI